MDLLREVLESVQSGRTSFSPEGDGEVELRQFQAGAMALDFAQREGLLGKLEFHRNARFGTWLIDAVFVTEGLTFEGSRYLSEPEPEKLLERKCEDVIELRPNFMGIGINLRELFRRLFKKEGL